MPALVPLDNCANCPWCGTINQCGDLPQTMHLEGTLGCLTGVEVDVQPVGGGVWVGFGEMYSRCGLTLRAVGIVICDTWGVLATLDLVSEFPNGDREGCIGMSWVRQLPFDRPLDEEHNAYLYSDRGSPCEAACAGPCPNGGPARIRLTE
ncbi:MAG: hypothetical protein KDA58_09835 [Planctomycetaceae bacterium]|nr:hypothetical protein [Planctomycetaceae bacterium]